MEHIPMMTTDTTQHAAAPEELSEEEFERRYPPGHSIHKQIRQAIDRSFSDIFSFWCLCDLAACRRAGCCKGNPSHCVGMFRPMLADDVHDGGIAVFEGKMEGLSFEQLLERHRDELMAWIAWKLRIENRPGAP